MNLIRRAWTLLAELAAVLDFGVDKDLAWLDERQRKPFRRYHRP